MLLTGMLDQVKMRQGAFIFPLPDCGYYETIRLILLPPALPMCIPMHKGLCP